MATKKDLEKQIRALKKDLKKYKAISIRDELTGLYNRRKFELDIERNLVKEARTNRKSYTIVMLDIDKFKEVNDTYGHKAGDKKLIEVAKALTGAIRSVDKAYRLSGDEFILKLYHCKNIKRVLLRIKKLIKKLDITVSIGYNKLCDDIIEQVDKKMYCDKRKHQGGK